MLLSSLNVQWKTMLLGELFLTLGISLYGPKLTVLEQSLVWFYSAFWKGKNELSSSLGACLSIIEGCHFSVIGTLLRSSLYTEYSSTIDNSHGEKQVIPFHAILMYCSITEKDHSCRLCKRRWLTYHSSPLLSPLLLSSLLSFSTLDYSLLLDLLVKLYPQPLFIQIFHDVVQ